jgi:hypothetical protein
MDFPHRVDRFADVLEGVVRPRDPDLAVAKRPAFVGSSVVQSTGEDG